MRAVTKRARAAQRTHIADVTAFVRGPLERGHAMRAPVDHNIRTYLIQILVGAHVVDQPRELRDHTAPESRLLPIGARRETFFSASYAPLHLLPTAEYPKLSALSFAAARALPALGISEAPVCLWMQPCAAAPPPSSSSVRLSRAYVHSLRSFGRSVHNTQESPTAR